MSEQHTPTPWGFSRDDENGVEFNITSDKWYVAVCCDAPGNAFPQDNARRIVACVNACAGIPTDDLEQCPSGGLFHIADHANELVKQRDELLAALNAIEPFIPKTSAKEGGAAAYSANVRAADLVRSAIASVKANTK